mgnify:CR=1 FL=1
MHVVVVGLWHIGLHCAQKFLPVKSSTLFGFPSGLAIFVGASLVHTNYSHKWMA